MGIKKRKSKKGFTVIEAVISLVLFTMIMIPLGSFTLTAVKTSVKSATKEQAVNAGQGALEQLKTIKLSQLNKMTSDANYSETNKSNINIGDLTVTKEKDKSDYEITGKYKDPNNNKEFSINGTISQSKLENSGDKDSEHSFGGNLANTNYFIYIGQENLTVYRMVYRDNLPPKYIQDGTITIPFDNPYKFSIRCKGENDSSYNVDARLRDWLLVKYKTIVRKDNEILTLFIDKDENGHIDINALNDEDGKDIPTQSGATDEQNSIEIENRKRLNDALEKYVYNYNEITKDGVTNKVTNIEVHFYESVINKEVNLKISNESKEQKLNIYTYKIKGSGARYNIYTSTDSSLGDISVFKNYIEGSSKDLRGQLYNINLNINDKDNKLLYHLNTTEFIGE